MFRRFCRFFLVAAALVAAPLAQAQLVIPGGGGGASVGGSSGQLQFNNAGVLGGGAGTAWDDTNRTLTISGATVTSSKPMLDLSQTWNAGAVAFTGLKFNVTDTASASGSLLMDLQVGGSSIFSVRKDGVISSSLGGGLTFNSSGGYTNLSVTNSGFTVLSTLGIGANDAAVSRLGAASLAIGNGTAGDFSGKLTLGSLYFGGTTSSIYVNGSLRLDYGATTGSVWTFQGPLAFTSDASYYSLGAALDVRLYRDGADKLALRNGANAQTFNIYNTYTDASNYERGFIGFSSNAFYIQTQAAGTGTARDLYIRSASNALYFGTGGAQNWQISSGNLLASTDNTYDIGASGANRPRNAFMANNITVGGAVITSFINNGNNANTIFQFTNSSANAQFAPGASTPLLQLGGTTSSFPAIKRNAAAINFRLADDTGDAAVTASGFTSTTAGLGLGMAAGGEVFWNGRGQIFSPADGQLKLSNWAATAGAILDFATDATVKFRNTANSADAAITAASISTSSTTLHTTTVALTNGAAAATGTLTNAPVAGNPTKWFPINDNGTTRYVPAW